MPLAQAGHGVTIAMETDPTGTPGVFTAFAQLNGDITWPELSRPETEVTPHEVSIDEWVLGVLTRGPLTFGLNFIHDHATHDHLTGVYAAIKSNEMRGFRLRGPGGTDDDDEIICSGQIQSVTQTSPVRTGARTAEVTVRLSGPMIIDGVVFDGT